MTGILRTILAEGITAALPQGWEYSAESFDAISATGIDMSNGSCQAHFQLLNPKNQSANDFLSSYKFSLMQGLSELGVIFEAIDPRFPSELRATKEGVEGTIIHSFIPTNPVGHLSAIAKTPSDILEVRLIAESIQIDSISRIKTEDELVPMRLSSEWHKSPATQS